MNTRQSTLSMACTSALLLGTLTPPLAAQNAGGGDATTLDSIKVTAIGTNIEGIQPVGSNSLAVERETMMASGLGTVVDVMRTLPQVQANDVYREGGSIGSDNATNGNSVNLRGIGAAATLVLIDGRRVAQTGTSTAFTEANQVPMAALERVEIIADGASAVYGSDAVAGIVNYVLRKDYQGTEVSWRFSDEGGFHQRVGSLVSGLAWDTMGGGNLIFAWERTDRDALVAGKNPLLKQDLSRYGGLDGRLNGNTATPGFNANIVVPRADGSINPSVPGASTFDYWSVPPGSNGMGLAADDLLFNQPNLLDAADYSEYLGKMKRDQYSLYLNQQLTPWLSFYTEGLHRERKTVSRTMSGGAGSVQYDSRITLPSSSPYHISGIPGVAPGAPLTLQYNAYKDVGPILYTNTEKQTTISAGLKAELPGEWKGELYYTDSRNESCGVCSLETFINWDAFRAQVAAGNINPLSNEPLGAVQYSTFIGQNYQLSTYKVNDTMLKFNGPLFSIPGGKVRAAAGVEHLRNSNFLINEANRGPLNEYVHDTTSGLARDIDSIFAELYIPIIGAGNARRGIKSLSLSGAVRRDRYSDMGTTTNPKFGLTWDINDALSMRGSWGKSFRAPSLPELNPLVFSAAVVQQVPNNSGDPDIVNGAFPGWTNQLLMLGSNADLRPETAKTWSAGFDYTFTRLEGLRLSATYYSVAYENRIARPPNDEFYVSPDSRQLWTPLITPVHQPAGCVEGDFSTYDPAVVPFLSLPVLFGGPIVNACEINVVTDARSTNLAATRQVGVDLELNWAIPSDFGFWNIAASTTRVLKHEQQLGFVQPPMDRRGMYNESSTIRSRVNIGWYQADWGVNLFANHVGAWTNDLPITVNGVRQPEHRVGAWITWDLGMSWAPEIDTKWLHGVRVGLNVNNVFDRDPPIVLSGNSAFNPTKSNPFGRTWALSVTLSY